MRSIVVVVALVLMSTPVAADSLPAGTRKILGDMVVTKGHTFQPDDIPMYAPRSRTEYAGVVFLVPKSDVALAELDGWTALTHEEHKAWLAKKFDEVEAAAVEEERSAALDSADRWRISAILLGVSALAATALATWLMVKRRAAG